MKHIVLSCNRSVMTQRVIFSAAYVGMLFLASSAHSQDTTLEQPRKVRSVMEEVIVTAQKKSESVNDVPIAINAISGGSLKALGVTDTRDLGIVIPGLTYADSGYATPIYTLRGVGFNDATYNATSTVGIYVDEVNLPYSVMTKGANLDLERVEVLKGPQGTLYGRNTTGGLINYIANKAGDSFEAGLSVGYSRFRTTELEAFISAPLSDSVGARVAVRNIHTSEGYQKSLTRPDDTLGEASKQSARAAIDWDVNEDLEFRFVVDGWSDDSDPQAAQPIGVIAQNASAGEAALSPQITSHPLVPIDTDDVRVADWATEYDWQLKQRFSQASIRGIWSAGETLRFTGIISHGEVTDDGTLLPQSGYSVLNAEQELNASIRTSAIEFRAEGALGDSIDWMVGVNASSDKGYENHILNIDTNSALFPVTGTNPVSNFVGTFGEFDGTQTAGFININWHIVDSLKFDIGVRSTRDVRDFTGCSYEPLEAEGTGLTTLFNGIAASKGGSPTIQKGECVTLDENGSNKQFEDTLAEENLSGRAALSFTPNDNTLIYTSASVGFKSGGFPVLSSSNQAQYESVKQEELLALELGAKNTFFDGALQLNSALFYYDYRDKQLITRLLDDVFGPLPVLKNAPRSNVKGVELELTAQPLEGLLIKASGSFIKTEIKEFESTGFDGSPQDFAGNPFNFTPELEYTLLVDYSRYVNQDYLAGIGVDYSYTDESNSTLDQNPLFGQDSFGLMNVRLRIEDADETWKASIYSNNITNEFSTISIIQAGDGAARFAGRPNIVGVSFSYNWF